MNVNVILKRFRPFIMYTMNFSDRTTFLTFPERFMAVYELFWYLKGHKRPKSLIKQSKALTERI